MTSPVTDPGSELFANDKAARALEAVYLTADLVAQRRTVMALLAAQPGERIADVGCGPGLLALDLAAAVGPAGHVLAVDVSESMVSMASQRCAGLGYVRTGQAHASALPAPDGALDALVCTQVLEYVPDAAGALREFARVLRPGGRLLLMDTDWESCVWHSGDPARMRRIIDAWDSHCAHPHLPGRLVPMLADAGFTDVRVSVHALVTHTRFAGTFCEGMIDSLSRHAVRTAQVDAETVAGWRDDLLRIDADGRTFFSLNRHLFIAVRA